jgi:hypothetical protein
MPRKAFLIVLLLALAIPVFSYFWVFNFYAINIPKWDDHALKAFLLEYTQAGSWSGRWEALFRQHNEHRILLTRLVALIDYRLFGSLNYVHLMVVGNIMLLSALVLFWLILRANKKPLFALVPIPFIWLTLANWENMYWGMASIQNFGVVVLVLWVLYLIVARQFGYFVLALALVAVTVVTSGNGLLLLPIGALVLFLAKKWSRFGLWLVMSGVYGFGYFFSYVAPASNHGHRAGLLDLLTGYLAFLGSFAESFPVKDHFQLCIILGAVLFLVAVSIIAANVVRLYLSDYDYPAGRPTDLFCLGTLLFILGTAAIVVYARADVGLGPLITSRYKIYSLLLLVVGYLYVVIPIRGSFLTPYISGIVFLTVLYNIFSYHYHLVDAFNLRKSLTTSRFNWTYPTKYLGTSPDTSRAAALIMPTPVFYDRWLPLLPQADSLRVAGQEEGLGAIWEQTRVSTSATDLEVRNSQYSSQLLQDSGVYVLLSSAARYYLYPTYRTRNTNRKQLFLRQQYFAPGFGVDIPYAELDSGRYAVGLVWQRGGQTGILFQKDSVTTLAVKQVDIQKNW